jgi:hypothetical protein
VDLKYFLEDELRLRGLRDPKAGAGASGCDVVTSV